MHFYAKGRAMSKIKKYGFLLSAVTDKFNNMDFRDYSPSQVIDSFWTEHNWSDPKINLFDLILMARGNKPPEKNSPEDLDKFLDNFASFMIASYTVHYLNHNDSKIGSYLSEQRTCSVKEEVRFDFLQRLLGIQ